MGVRLNKVLSELNIGLQTAVDFLKNKKELGEVKEEMTPNTKITDSQYQALVGAFSGDKAVKTQAEMIFAKKAKDKKAEKAEKKSNKAEDLLEQRQQFKPLGKIDLDSVGKKKAANSDTAPVAAAVSQTEASPIVEKKEEPKPVAEQKAPEAAPAAPANHEQKAVKAEEAKPNVKVEAKPKTEPKPQQ